MTKVRLLTLLAVVALVLLPAIATSQGLAMPCRFHGTVQVDGADVDDGTTITATIEGDPYTTDTPSVYGDSTYLLEIAPPEGTTYSEGAVITFTIGDETVGTSAWESGGNIELDLESGEGQTIPDGSSIKSVKVNPLPAGSTPTVNLDTKGVLTFGIPDGAKGDTGAAGTQGIQGPKGDKGDTSSIGLILGIVGIILAVVAIAMALMAKKKA